MEALIGKRIMVVGSPGSGKSHFSTELSYRTGLPLFHLDRNLWSGDGAMRDPAEAQRFVEWQTRTVTDDEWIFDGNYNGTMKLRLARADTVFCFQLPRLFCLFGYLRRLLFSRFSLDAPQSGEQRERFNMKFVKHIWNFKQTDLLDRLQQYPNLRVFIFRRRIDRKRFFDALDFNLAAQREARLKEFEE